MAEIIFKRLTLNEEKKIVGGTDFLRGYFPLPTRIWFCANELSPEGMDCMFEPLARPDLDCHRVGKP